MDKLQRYLQSKEAESPSPSLVAEPPTKGDRVKAYANSIFRRVKRQSPEDTNPLAPYSLKETPYYKVEDERRDYWEIKDARRGLGNTLSRIGKMSDRGVIGWVEVNRAYESLKKSWSENHYSFDKSGKFIEGVRKIFEKRAQKCLDARIDETVALAREGNLDEGAYRVAKGEAEFWGWQGINPKISLGQILDIYLASDNKSSLADVPDGIHIAHMLSDGSRESFNNNQLHSRLDRLEEWDYFGDKALKLRPSLSCVAFTPNEPFERRFFSPVGILMEEALIHDASGRDCGSKPVRPDVRLSIFSKRGCVKERLREALVHQPPTHREVVIGADWEPKGIFYELPHASKKDLDKARRLAEQHKLAIYEFIEGKGFREVKI
ncbi:MAG: hypothetical protein ACP5NS_04300 [Candidatus Pacearchaeota archaeon]